MLNRIPVHQVAMDIVLLMKKQESGQFHMRYYHLEGLLNKSVSGNGRASI